MWWDQGGRGEGHLSKRGSLQGLLGSVVLGGGGGGGGIVSSPLLEPYCSSKATCNRSFFFFEKPAITSML